MKYYYEIKGSSKGWETFNTDEAALRYFNSWRVGGIKVWRVAQDGTKTLILKRKNK